VDLVNYASNTGDVAPLRAARKGRCKVCRGIESGISAVYDEGGRLEGAGWSVTSAQALPLRGGQFVVALALRIASERRYENGAVEPTVSRPTEGLLDVHVEPDGGSWAIYRLVPNQ
jgi:hypothetical protein